MRQSRSDEALVVDQEGGVLTLTNNDPPRNRMTFEYMDAVETTVRDAAHDASIRALVFTAAGDEHFSVGMDLKQLMSGAGDRGGIEAVLDQRLRVLAAIEQLGRPSIATLFEYCLGGGLELRWPATFAWPPPTGPGSGFRNSTSARFRPGAGPPG